MGAVDDAKSRPRGRAGITAVSLWVAMTACLGLLLTARAVSLWGFGSLAAAMTWLSLSRLSRPREGPSVRRGLLVGESAISLVTGPGGAWQRLVLALDRPFGLTLLCNSTRERLVLAITTRERTFYVGARVSPPERQAHATLLARACTAPDDDPALDAIAPDNRPLELTLRDFAELYRRLARRDRRAENRCFLSDTHGEDVVLDGNDLRIGSRHFDLSAPLEWRALFFQEAIGSFNIGASDTDPHVITGAAATVYQGTWVRQRSAEAVLVALVPASTATANGPIPAEGDGPELHRARIRDRRLLQAWPDAPPPRELRIGIERSYMVPLRAALDRAPRSWTSGDAAG